MGFMIAGVPLLRLKTLIARMLCHPLIGRLIGVAFGNRIPAHGLTFATSDPIIQPKTKAELFWGIYEKAEVGFVRRYIAPGSTVLELGCSLGVTSCVIAEVVGSEGCLVGVEANPEIVPACRQNLRANAPEAKVTLQNRAIDYSGKDSVWLDFGNDSTSSRTQAVTDTEGRRGAWVTTSTLARLIDEFGVGEYALVCDIEGAEYGILTQDGDALGRCQLAIVELHAVEGDDHRRVDPAQMLDLFVGRHGFSVRDQRGPVFVFEKRGQALIDSSPKVPL